MDAKDSLSNLLTLLTQSAQLTENTVAEEGSDVMISDKTDLEVAAVLLGLCSANFSDIAEGLDNLVSLNSAADEFNEYILEMIESFDRSYDNIISDVGALMQPSSSGHNGIDTAEASVYSTVSLKSPSEEHLAKYKFMTAGLEENLAKMKVYPYYLPPDVVESKRTRQRDADDGIVTSLDRCMSSRDNDAVLTLQTLDEVSKSIVDLRKRNDIDEELLNLEYNYALSSHLLSPPLQQPEARRERPEITLTEKFIEEIRQLEAECEQMDDELSRAMHQSFNNY